MNDRLQGFLELSVCLTGFDRLHLQGTGMTAAYLDELDAILSPAFMDELLAVFRALPSGDAQEAALSRQVLDEPHFGPVARNIVLMWYCGTWKSLPQEWRTAHGASPRDTDHVVSANAYLTGLQWAVVGAHPPGGMPPGFGSWAAPVK